MNDEREMRQIIESMESMVAADVLGMADRQDQGQEITDAELDEMSMGKPSFNKLLNKMFLSSLWDRIMVDLEKRGFDNIEVQNRLFDYFTVVLRRFFSSKGIGVATVKPYEMYWTSMQGKDPVLKGMEPNYSGLAAPVPWDKLFEKMFGSKEFDDVLYRYGKTGPDSKLDFESAKRVIRNGMHSVVKQYFGRGGRVSIQPAVTVGEASDGAAASHVGSSAINRLVDAMIMSPRVERLISNIGLADEADFYETMTSEITNLVKLYLSKVGVRVQGASQAKTAVMGIARS